MDPRDFRKAAPYLGGLPLTAVVFIIVRYLLYLRFCSTRLPELGDSISSELGLQSSPDRQIPKLTKADKLLYDTLAFSAEVIAQFHERHALLRKR